MLKPNHKYYDQVQFTMGMLKLPECDLFLWTDKGSITVTVPFNRDRWDKLRSSSKNFHWDYLVPEYFMMRSPRELELTTLETVQQEAA